MPHIHWVARNCAISALKTVPAVTLQLMHEKKGKT